MSPTSMQLVRKVAVTVLLVTAGCGATSMTAATTRVPILLGPVACIGCPAVSVPVVPYAAAISDRASYWTGTVTLFGSADISGGTVPQIDSKADAAVPDPCAGELYVSKLKASSFSIFAFFLISSEEKIELEAAAAPVAGGACAAAPGGGLPGGSP